MDLKTAGEVGLPAFPAFSRCQQLLDPALLTAFAASELATLNCTLRYVPIVMGPEMLAGYPPRSKLHIKQRAYDCTPVLDFSVFVAGSLSEQVEEYIRGLAEATSHLARLGASEAQMRCFTTILRETVARVLATPDQNGLKV